MNLLDPWKLLWLLAFVPPLVLLYFLKLRRKETLFSSTLLWQRSVQDLRANAPFQRLRRNLLLLLQLLLLALLGLALARPAQVGKEIPGRFKVVLIDQSASMATRDEDGRTRLEAALDTARGLVDDPDRENMMIVGFGAGTRAYCSFSASSIELEEALAKVRQHHTSTRLEEALEVARTALQGKTSGAVILLSDGAFPAPVLTGDQELEAEVLFFPFGRTGGNAGIVDLDVRRPLEGGADEATQILVNVYSTFSAERSGVLELRRDGELLDAAEVLLVRDEVTTHIFRRGPEETGHFVIGLTPEDDLPVDNAAHLVLETPEAARIGLVSKGNFFLKNALEKNLEVEVVVLDPEEHFRREGERSVLYPEELPESADLLVFDGRAPANRVALNALYLGCLPALPGVAPGDTWKEPLVIDWNRTHPITRYVDFSSLYLRQARAFTLSDTVVPLIETREGVLAACHAQRGVRTVWTGFDLEKSDWPVQVSFPVFLKNAVNWLAPPSLRRGYVPSVRPGAPLPVPAAADGSPARVTTPGGDTTTVARAPGRPAYFPDTFVTGAYRVDGAEGGRLVPVNLLSREETDVAPRSSISLGERTVSAADHGEGTTREFWRLALLLGVVLLALEWYVYHRRSG